MTAEQREDRARNAANARLTTDHYIQKLLAAWPPLTDEQRAKLRPLLRPGQGDGTE
jgi:hypothetical protein